MYTMVCTKSDIVEARGYESIYGQSFALPLEVMK
jgi:hypothetical protein